MGQAESLNDLEHMQIREVNEICEEKIERLAEFVNLAVDAVMEALKPLADRLRKMFDVIVDVMAAGIVPKKWIRLSKRAKKGRTRKKYRNRIIRAVLAELRSNLQEE